jgi:hypothetical protein
MKRILMSTATALGCMLFAHTASAQTSDTVYDVPFSFNAAGVQLPAGTYRVSHATPRGVAMLLRGQEGGIALLIGAKVTPSGPGHLTFNKYGDKYFLEEVAVENGRTSNIRLSSQEREMKRNQERAAAVATEVALRAQR